MRPLIPIAILLFTSSIRSSLALISPAAKKRPVGGRALPPSSTADRSGRGFSFAPPLRMGFLSDLFKEAFDNDGGLSSEKSQGQIEGPGVDDGRREEVDLTDVQRRFLASGQAQRRKARGTGSAPIEPSMLVGTDWDLNLYLAGVPDKDPSNDLYGRRINISSRDRNLSLGAEMPADPSATVRVRLSPDGVCDCDPSPFTTGKRAGQWKLSDDGRYLRLSIDGQGYCRTVTTRGTITKVFWSDSDEQSSKTSTTYSIPEGFVYCDVEVGYGIPGEFVMQGEGVVKVERKQGMLGVSTNMASCGKVTGKMVTSEVMVNP